MRALPVAGLDWAGMEKLGYKSSRGDRAQSSHFWDVLCGLSIIVPFLVVPVFVFGTAWLQDELVNGDGRSWLRAALWTGVPAGLVTLAALAGAIRALARDRTMRWVIVSVLAANALSLGIIIIGIISAA
jgi:hypothetical protein